MASNGTIFNLVDETCITTKCTIIRNFSSPWLLNTILTLMVTYTSYLILRFIRYRQSYKDVAPFIPSPPFNLLTGTLAGFGKMFSKAPRTAHPHGIMTMLYREYGLKDLFILDSWPFLDVRQIIIADPDLAAQCTQTHSLPKSPHIERFVGHIAGKRSMLFTEGMQWKKNRALFNPGFAITHLITLVPSIVDESAIFSNVLGKYADSGEVHPIEEAAALATIDIMGHVVLGISLNSQKSKNELMESFRGSMSWTPKASDMNPFAAFDPIRPIMQRYYTWKMNSYLEKVLNNRFIEKGGQTTMRKQKPVIDIALDEYIHQLEEENVPVSSHGLDDTFKEVSIDQMKTFLFAGHDTSSSTICYAYFLLSRHPEKLAKARNELEEVFGKDTSKTGDLIKEDPSIVNRLPYILSCIKETLRIYPPADTVRQGQKGFSLNYKGKQISTEGFMIMVSVHTMHRRDDLFPSPDEFIPERFMPAPNNFQNIPKDAWRPFEKGPRACIGQELALLEMKIIMAMTLREFDIQVDYETWDRKLGREKPGDILGGRRGMFGDRAFQELIASAKPSDGMPAKVIRRTQTHN